jgi:recombination protein RecT
MSTNALRTVATGKAPNPKADFPVMLEHYKGEIARALPRHLNADTMARIALTCFRMNPKLAECKPASVFAAVIQASQIGLRPGLLGECYLIPYKDECTLQIGYQGLLELVRRSGLVDSIGAYLVHEKDVYEVRFGTDAGVTHKPFLDSDRGPVKFGYAVAHLKGGGRHVEVMTLDEIQRIRDRSQNVRNAKRFDKQTPWDTDFEEMARKTLIRRICKYLPKSNELATALAVDSHAVSIEDAIGNTFVPPAIEGEAKEKPSEAIPTDVPQGDPSQLMPGDMS